MTGCLHLELQPKGAHPKTGRVRPALDFDIRLLKGKAIPKLTPAERALSEAMAPSPSLAERLAMRRDWSAAHRYTPGRSNVAGNRQR